MSGYIGASTSNQQKRFINGNENNHINNGAKHYLNQNYLKTQSQADNSGSYSKLNITSTPKRDIQNEKSKIAGRSTDNYGLINQRGGYSLYESSHESRDNPKVSSNHSPFNNPSKEFFTNKTFQISSQPQRQEGKGQTSSQRAISGYESQLPYPATIGAQIRNTANVTPKKQYGFQKKEDDRNVECSLERFRGVQRQGEFTSRKISGHNEIINASNQEIINKMKQLSNSPISRTIHTNIPLTNTFNTQVKYGINSKAEFDGQNRQSPQGVTSCSSKTPKSAKNITGQNLNTQITKYDQQTQLLKGHETDRMKRSITPTDVSNGGTTKASPNLKLQEMLNRVHELTSNLKAGSSSNNQQHQLQISPSSELGQNLERRLTPMHQDASDGFTPRSDTSHNHKTNQASPGMSFQQQQQTMMMTVNSSKGSMNNKVNQDYQRYLEQQQQYQQSLTQHQGNAVIQNQKGPTRDTSQKSNKTSNNRVNQTAYNQNNINNNCKIRNSNKDPNAQCQIPQNNSIPLQKQQQQQQQLSQLKTLNIDLFGSKQFQKQMNLERPQQRQQETPTFAQVAQLKQLSSNQNQFQNFSGRSNQNNTEEANTTSGSGNTYANISQSYASHNSPSQNDLSQENSQKKSTGQDAALLRLLQEKLGDQYSYLLAGRQIEQETPRKAPNMGNNQNNMKASDIQRDQQQQQSSRSTTPKSKHSGLIKQQSSPTIFSQSPQQSSIIDNQLSNSSILKQHQEQLQQYGQVSTQDVPQQIAWLRQQQQQQQQIQEEIKNSISNGVSSPSLNMYYPQFSEYLDSIDGQENQQNNSSNQLLKLTNSQYFNHNNLCSQPDINQSNSQYLYSSPDLNNSTSNVLFNPYMINNFQQSKVDSQSLPFDQIKNNPANLLYLQQLQQQQLQFLQAQQSFPQRSDFIQNPVFGQMNTNQQILQQHLANSQFLSNQNTNLPFQQQQSQQPLPQSSFSQYKQPQKAEDQVILLQSQRLLKEDSTSLKPNNLQEECISSTTSSTNTPVTIQINNQISNTDQQLSEEHPPVPDSTTFQRIIKSCSRAEECIFELLQSREFEHQAHFLIKYHLLLPDLPFLQVIIDHLMKKVKLFNPLLFIQKLPISSADMKEITRAINMQIILVQVIVYEHIVVIKQLRESVRGAVSMNENLQNILNSFQYVHSSLLLTLIIFEQTIQNLKDQGDTSVSSVDISGLSATIRERIKRRKMGFLLKNSDKLSMLKKFNDILQPLLQILIEGQIEVKEDKQNEKDITQTQKESNSFYDKLLEIQDQITSMPIDSTIQIAEQLSKENIQLVQDEADKIALIHERKTFTTIKESHGENLIHFSDSDNEESKISNQKQDSPQRSLNKQLTFKAQTQSQISSQQDSEQHQENDKKKVEEETIKKLDQIQQKQSQETQEIPNQELSFFGCGSINPPYLKEPSLKKYTLVLDLDETLVHYQELEDGGQFLVRPYAETFLEEMSEYYEIIIFTAGLQDYADFILDIIDVKKSISHRFYRQHTTLDDNFNVKDLSRIGRNLDKTLIIDNLAENFKYQPENGIQIQSWYGEPEDRALYDLTPLLKQIVQKRFKKVQTAFTQFREKTIQNISKGIQDPHLNLSLDPLPEDIDD